MGNKATFGGIIRVVYWLISGVQPAHTGVASRTDYAANKTVLMAMIVSLIACDSPAYFAWFGRGTIAPFDDFFILDIHSSPAFTDFMISASFDMFWSANWASAISATDCGYGRDCPVSAATRSAMRCSASLAPTVTLRDVYVDDMTVILPLVGACRTCFP